MAVSRFPVSSETFLVRKFVGLALSGLDVHVACGSQLEPGHFEEELDRVGDWRRRVHPQWPLRPRWLAALLLPVAVIVCFMRAPRESAVYLARGWGRFRLDVLRRFYLDAAVISARPGILHFEFGALAPERIYVGELLGCRTVVSFRGYDLNFSGTDDPGHYRVVWSTADGIHCLGEDLWRRAVARGCPPDMPHVLIPPAVDPDAFAAPERRVDVVGTPERPLRIVSVGRLDWKKGYEHALQALHRLRIAGITIEYRVLGSGDYLGPLAFCRHQLGLEREVSFLGGEPPEVVRAELARADVFLHAAVTEGFCNAVVEAQAMELPVVCSDAGGLPENVADGETGFVVGRRDPGAMAERLSELARNPRLRREMGRAGRERVLRLFCLPDQIRSFGSFYRNVAEGGGIAPASPAARETRAAGIA